MGWLPQSVWNELKQKALALTAEQRAALTWDEARLMKPADTLAMARFSGVEKGGGTPWQALAASLGLIMGGQT